MLISQILTPERMLCNVQVNHSKRRLLEHLGQLFAKSFPELDSLEVYQQLFNRERLGSTGIGRGVAIPHARLANLDETVAAFMSLEQGIGFDAIDDKPVDLVFALLVPAKDGHDATQHLQVLAYLAAMFSDETFCQQLRSQTTIDSQYQLMVAWQPPADL